MSCCPTNNNESISILNKTREAAVCASNNCASAAESAEAAATSAYAASVSAGQAAASAALSGIYLGPKETAPTTDNSGNPLQEGMQYFNTTDDVLYIWNGTSWQSSAFNEFTDFTATGTTTARDLVTRMADVVNVLDFIPLAEQAAIKAGTSTYDATADIQAAFDAATGIPKKTVYIPAGIYNVGELLYGNQSTTTGSPSPTSLIGDGWSSVLKAKQGFTGTILNARNVVGVLFENFQINGNGTAETCIDTSYNFIGIGPSVQNKYSHIKCLGCTETVWKARHNNDSIFINISTTASASDKCCIDLEAGGGLASICDSLWNTGYLKFGAQNGTIENCWGMGIQFDSGSKNYVSINASYIYSNPHLGSCLKSESFASGQSVHSLTCIATQFIGREDGGNFFNLSLYSTADFIGCWFISPDSLSNVNMFGPNCRRDSFVDAKVLFRGGSVRGNHTINQANGFLIETDRLLDDSTGKYRIFNGQTFTNAGSFTSGQFYDLIPANKLKEGSYIIEFYWNEQNNQPYIIRASAIISILSGSFANVTETYGNEIIASTATYFTNDGGYIKFRLAGDTTGKQKIQFCWIDGLFSSNLPSGATYSWQATKIG